MSEQPGDGLNSDVAKGPHNEKAVKTYGSYILKHASGDGRSFKKFNLEFTSLLKKTVRINDAPSTLLFLDAHSALRRQ